MTTSDLTARKSLEGPEGSALAAALDGIPDSELAAAVADHAERGLLTLPAADGAAAPAWPPERWPIFPRLRVLRAGCYLASYSPRRSGFPWVFPLVSYIGTLRVETFGGAQGSGDLYSRPLVLAPPGGLPAPSPNPAAGVPVFARSRYRYYLRVTSLPWLTFGSSLQIGFERHAFDQATGGWTNEGAFTATMSWTTAPAGYPDPAQYLSGEVRDVTGRVVGTLSMGWVSEHLRRAVVEIDRVAASEAPTANAAGTETWATIGAKSGWRVEAQESHTNLAEPSGQSWSDAELHAQLLASRDAHNLDGEWRYVLLAVRRLDSTTRGIMFDAFATDSNNVPREGAAISSHWVIPNDPAWGTSAGLRFGTAADAYFRTAVHELGHAFNLIHNESEGIAGTTFMTTTPSVVANGTAADPFPGNITWDFHPDNQHRLRHWPDVYVRPGGRPFASAHASTPIPGDEVAQEAAGITLEVRPLLERVPLGAPVRAEVVLRNVSEAPVPVPASLRFDHGHLSGRVTGSGGGSRRFRSIVRCIDEETTVSLPPGAAVVGSVTLLRGPDGPLFGAPGLHTIAVEAEWSVPPGVPVRAVGAASVLIEAPASPAHADAALAALRSPDLHVVVELGGGEHLTDGVAALETALASEPLRPHYAVTQARRSGRSFFQRAARAEELVDALVDDVVATADEVRDLGGLLGEVSAVDADRLPEAVHTLRSCAARNPAVDQTTDLLPDELG